MTLNHCMRAALGLVVCLLATSARAAITLPELFSDHMVLQRDMEVPVWGTAAPGEKVTVEFAGKKAQATADGQGNFVAKLPPLKVGEATSLKISGDKTAEPIEFKDVLVGDVWICSGQSNMQWEVRRSANPKEEAATAANYPKIRFFQVPRRSSMTKSLGLERADATTQPAQLMQAQWAVCTPETATEFSAVGYFFAREIHKVQGVPVGLIQNAWGGMPVESFMSEEAIQADPDFHVLLEKREKAATQDVKGPGGQVRKPNAPQFATNIYNRMVYPILPYAIKGVIWYQGESNAGRAEQYRKLFPAMIRDWRKQWKQGEFPFLFVQLANYGNRKEAPKDPADSDWAELREAQTMALKEPNTGMAVTIDIGDTGDIHPKNKQDVGKRLALAAQKVAYGKGDVAYSGPIYREMNVEGNKVRIKFDQARGLNSGDANDVRGFAVAGEDKKFVWADAKIDGDEVIVWSDEVAKPVAVRYGWADDPKVSLYNAAGLPASPFRTDDWPMITAGKK